MRNDMIRFSRKQRQVLTWWRQNRWQAIICDGAVRSGKTFCMGLSFFLWAQSCFDGRQFALCGKTVGALRRNLLTELVPCLRRIGMIVRENRSANSLTVEFGGQRNQFLLFGGKDESSAALIQGSTLAGLLLDEADTKPLEEGQVEQMNFCFHLMLGKASPKMLEVYRFLAENAERIGHLKHTPFYDGDKCTTWHISQGLGLYKVKPKEMEKIPALILTASLIRNPDTRLQALADELYERYGGSWLIPVFMKAIITQPKEQVYETYSLLLGTPKEIYLFNALGMLDYRCYPEDWIYERLGPDGMTAFIFWGHERYGSYDTTFMFERYVELDERWLFDLAKDPEGRKPTVTWQSYNRSGVLYESYDEMFISLLPRKVENPELKHILRDYFRIRSQKKKVAKSITVYQDAAERFGD